MKRLIAILAAVLFAASAFALTIPSSCESALRRALDADAAFRMERKLPDATRTLVSTGIVSCAANRGIVWDVRYPFASSVTMTTNAMIFVDEDEGRRVKPLKELPHYEDFRKETDRFLAGDPKAFDGAFAVTTRFTDEGGWILTLVPSSSAMKRLLTEVELHGDRTLDKAVIKSGDGGSATIVFTELGRKVHSLWKDEVK